MTPPRVPWEAPTLWQRMKAVVWQRCPRCCRGPLFHGWFAMNDPCPVCGLIFQREEGYFLGAMYVSYLIGVVLLGGGYFLATWLLPDWNEFLLLVGVFLLYLLVTPAVFRYARTVWIHFERLGSPTEVSAGPYEKVRAREQAQRDRERDRGNGQP